MKSKIIITNENSVTLADKEPHSLSCKIHNFDERNVFLEEFSKKKNIITSNDPVIKRELIDYPVIKRELIENNVKESSKRIKLDPEINSLLFEIKALKDICVKHYPQISKNQEFINQYGKCLDLASNKQQ